MDLRQVIAKKRDGWKLSEEDIRSVVLGYARDEVPDHVAAAFIMAAFIRGLDGDETLALTRAMVESGTTLSLGRVSRPKVDKHSTGGVADGVTLVFAPLCAALGVAVAKLSGRGLGHTGGTLDKLESIPALRTDLSPDELERQVDRVGCAVAAQSKDLVPADGALYALRDATATVPSVPLIAASVMSKKLAVGTDAVLLDVKAGSGAFMKTIEAAQELADACVRLAAAWGRPCRAAVTDMSQPLGTAVGNALDIAEAVEILRGDWVVDDTMESLRRSPSPGVAHLATTFAKEARDALEEGTGRRREAFARLADGSALEAFRRMVEAQGGDPRVVDDPWKILPRAPAVVPLEADRTGYLAAVDAEAIGWAAVGLGAGRVRKGDAIDPAVGVVFRPKIGDRVETGQPIGEIHARDLEAAQEAGRRVLAALDVSEDRVDPRPLLYGWRDA